jgi:hypothetical protein
VTEPITERPNGCRFWNADDVMRWIEENIDYEILGHNSSEKAALWWVAQYSADLVRDLNQRELMNLCIDGMKPITRDDIDAHLQSAWVDGEADEDTDRFVESDLSGFFNTDNISNINE